MTDQHPPTVPTLDPVAHETPLFGFLDRHAINYQVHRHEPLFTVAQSQAVLAAMPGLHVKNLFLNDKNDGLWLVTCLDDRSFKVGALQKALGAPRMSFGKPDLMREALGVTPGAVTPLAAFNDRDNHRVQVVIDSALTGPEPVNCHPLHNEATVSLSWDGLAHFFTATGHAPKLLDFSTIESPADAG